MARSQDSRIVDAVEAIYGAALTPAVWPEALQRIAEVFEDVGALLIYQRDDGGFGTMVAPGLEAAQLAYVNDGWWRQDIRMGRALERGYDERFAETVTERHILNDEEIVEHPFYRDFLLPQGLGWFAGTSISPDRRVIAALSIQRSRAKPPYSDEELALVERLGRHVEAALRLSIRLINAEVTNLALGEALSRLGVGVFLVDSVGRVVFANPAAEAMVGAGLVSAVGRIATSGVAQGTTLKAARDSAYARDALSAARPVLVRGRDPGSCIALHVFPIAAHAPDRVESLFTEAEAVVIAIDAAATEPDPAVVRDLLGLTLGEARVAALVGAGHRPAEAAVRLGITTETARTVLKRVFAKTGISRQSELAGLMARLVLR